MKDVFRIHNLDKYVVDVRAIDANLITNELLPIVRPLRRPICLYDFAWGHYILGLNLAWPADPLTTWLREYYDDIENVWEIH